MKEEGRLQDRRVGQSCVDTSDMLGRSNISTKPSDATLNCTF